MNNPPLDKCPVCQNVLRADPFFVGMDYWCDHSRPQGTGPHYICTTLDMDLNGKPSPLTATFRMNGYHIRIQMGDMSVAYVGEDYRSDVRNPVFMPAPEINWNDLPGFMKRLKKLLVFL